MRRWVALIAIVMVAIVSVGFYLAPRRDFLTPLHAHALREKHEYYKTDVRPTGGPYTGPLFAERTTYWFPKSDAPQIVSLLEKETTRRKWWTAIDQPNDLPRHAVFGSIPHKGSLIYMSDPYLLAVNDPAGEICVADIHEVTRTQYLLLRIGHPFSDPFPWRKP